MALEYIKALHLGVDFDGVLHSYKSGWKGHSIIPDEPVPGAIEWLASMMKEFQVFIHTTRVDVGAGGAPLVREAIRSWLTLWGFPRELVNDLEITHEKRPAHLYIDDRGFHFQGEFPSSETIRAFKPWNKK